MTHTEIYDEYFPGGRFCELTGRPGAEIHHIQARGMGGRKSVDVIENLMALSKDAHEYFGDKFEFRDWLKNTHLKYMETRVPLYKSNPHDPALVKFIIKTFPKIRFL